MKTKKGHLITMQINQKALHRYELCQNKLHRSGLQPVVSGAQTRCLCSRKFAVRGSCSGGAQGLVAGEPRRSVSCVYKGPDNTDCARFQASSDTALLNLDNSSCSS